MGLEVKVKIGADGSGFKAALDTVKSQAKSFSGDVSSGVLTGFAKGVAGIIPGIQAKLISLFDPTVIFEKFSAFIKNAKEIKLGSLRTGLDVVEFQRLRNTFEAIGLSVDTAEHALDHIARTQHEVNEGSVEMNRNTVKIAEAYLNLGVRLDELKSKSHQELLRIIFDRLRDVAAAGKLTGDQIAALTTVFGRLGPSMIPAIAAGDTVAANLGLSTEADIKKAVEAAKLAIIAKGVMKQAEHDFLSLAGPALGASAVGLDLKFTGGAATKYVLELLGAQSTLQGKALAGQQKLTAESVKAEQAKLATEAETKQVAKLEKETAEITEKAALKAMNSTERRAKLTAEIKRLEQLAAFADLAQDKVRAAEDRKEIAEKKSQLEALEKEIARVARGGVTPSNADRLGRLGLFLGPNIGSGDQARTAEASAERRHQALIAIIQRTIAPKLDATNSTLERKL